MATEPTIWIVGPCALDVVLYLDEFPESGHHTQPREVVRRIGGSPANVAVALASSGVKTSLVTAIGSDEVGELLRARLEAVPFDSLVVNDSEGESNQALVLVEADGERTILGLGGGSLGEINLVGQVLSSEDTVVFVIWHPSFADDLEYAMKKGCTTFVGLSAIQDTSVSADYAFGSLSDLPKGYPAEAPLDRFSKVVITRGAKGSTLYSAEGEIHQDAIRAPRVIDTTGAGDAFLAGFLKEYAQGDKAGARGLAAGAHWATIMVGLKESIPPSGQTGSVSSSTQDS